MNAGHTITTEPSAARVRVTVAGATVADSTNAIVLNETGLPVRYYLPRADVDLQLLVPTETTSNCPFKGDAVYWSARVGDTTVVDVAWSYPEPLPERADIAGHICFFRERVDAITVDDEATAAPDTPWSVLAEADHP